MNRAELLEQIHAGRKQLEETLAQFGAAEMMTAALPGGWTIKDVLAHLGWWERRIVSAYETLVRGEIPDPESDAVPVDELNARVFAQYHDRPLAEVRRDEGEAYRTIYAVAEHAPEDDLFNFQSPISNLQSPISNLQSPISNLQPLISNLQPPTSNLPTQTLTLTPNSNSPSPPAPTPPAP